MYVLYLSLLVLSTVLGTALALHLLRRDAPSAKTAAAMMIAAAVWSLGYVLQVTSVTLPVQIFATKVQYLGIVTVPVAWFIFSLQYTGLDTRLTRRKILLLAIVPLITVALAWTSNFHSLIWHNRHLEMSGPFLVIAKTYGPWFWVHTAYSYVLIFLGAMVLINRVFRKPRLYQQQASALIICVTVPLAWNVIYVFNLVSMPRVDLTPAAFTVSGLAMAWGLFRWRLLDVIPIIRDSVVEGMRDAIIVMDRHDRLVDLNAAAELVIGRRASTAIGQPVPDVLHGKPELTEIFSGKEGILTEVTIERGGEKHHLRVHISPMYDGHGYLIGRLAILYDITKQKLLEDQNRELEEKAHVASRLAAIGEMAAGIAHEVNNPLASVIGYADLLLQHDIPEEIRADLEVITRGARRAGNILDRLLTFAGRRSVEREYLNVNEVIETTIELKAHSLSNNNIEVIKQFAPNLPKTMGDGGQLQEVFLNLIVNAETSMRGARGRGKLIIQTETIDNSIRISFRDDGAGIAKDNLNKIFQPFFTTKDVGKGIGLGLSICHGIITSHGGRIYAESELGKGATFVIELPIGKK